MKCNNHKYCSISSLDELHLEKSKLHFQLEMKECELRRDWAYVRNFFSVGHLMDMACSRFSFSSVVDGIKHGIASVGSIFGRGRRRKKRGCGESEEE